MLRETIDRELPGLRALTDEYATRPPKPGSWSPKQELGHLIDSAANNQMRFIAASTEGVFEGAGYAQDRWVEAHGYQDLPWMEIVEHWYLYNVLLAHLIARIPQAHMDNRCVVGSATMTLGFVITDYVRHLRHHVDHVLSRAVLTSDPRV